MEGAILLNKIEIKNVRSLEDTGNISLSPITVLVGENSSGKSTFLRIFPLIKQSICKRTDGPLLWAGDVDDYVDFGSFSETVTKDSTSNTIVFQFTFALDKTQYYRVRRYNPFDLFLDTDGITDHNDIVYIIHIAQDNNIEFVSELSVKIDKVSFTFKFDPLKHICNIYVNGDGFDYEEKKEPDSEIEYLRNPFDGDESIFGFRLPDISCISDDLYKKIKHVKQKNREKNKLTYMSFVRAVLVIGEGLCCGKSLSQIHDEFTSNPDNDGLRSLVKDIVTFINDVENKQAKRCVAICELCYFYRRFAQIDEYLNVYFRQVHYIAPLRATAERYYRLRNLAIDEVDYQGKNLSIFLNGLNASRLKRFQDWTQEFFGFHVLVEKEKGHLSVKIALEGEATSVNMSDTGFGYSQILPIITQLWHLSTDQRKESLKPIPLVVAIEQPELHLHPALQAKLTDVFIASIKLAKEHGYQLQLILETHSETIVNRLGQAIVKGALKSKDVSIILFNKNRKTNVTNVQASTFDNDGYLNNWPVGFFSPEVEIR